MQTINTRLMTRLTALSVAALLAGCASQGKAPAAASEAKSTAATQASSYGPTKNVKSNDGEVDGEIIGSMVAGGKFSRLQIGMKMSEVLALIGGPDGMDSHETGKRWIPFYFGGDARRIEAFYKGEGCLSYTGGNAWGAGDNRLVRIIGTRRTDCME